MNSLNRIESDLSLMQIYLEKDDLSNSNISNWSVYKQIEHLLVSNNKIMSMILDPKLWSDEVKHKTLTGWVVLTTGYIPRGKAKAPKMAEPEGADLESLKKLHREVQEQLEEIKKIFSAGKNTSQVIGKHPYFGGLDIRNWIRMIEIHQRHHLKIVKDIVGSA